MGDVVCNEADYAGADRIKRRLDGAFRVVKIELPFDHRSPRGRRPTGHDHTEKLSFDRQAILALLRREAFADLEKLKVASLLIEVDAGRLEESGQQRRAHADRALDYRIP